METQELLEERGNRYGDFSEQSKIVQDLKDAMASSRNWEDLFPFQKEALEMIQHKIGRMLNGDPTYLDNIDDIIGYATLLREQTERVIEYMKTPTLFEGDENAN